MECLKMKEQIPKQEENKQNQGNGKVEFVKIQKTKDGVKGRKPTEIESRI